MTLIEIVAVFGIAMILLTMVTVMFSAFRDAQVLNGETSQVVSILDKARAQTLNSKGDSEYGVRVNGDRVILFTGLVFSSSSPSNEEYVLHSAVALGGTTITGGGTDIIFNRLTGETGNYGSSTVYLKSDQTKQHTIIVSKTGTITQN